MTPLTCDSPNGEETHAGCGAYIDLTAANEQPETTEETK